MRIPWRSSDKKTPQVHSTPRNNVQYGTYSPKISNLTKMADFTQSDNISCKDSVKSSDCGRYMSSYEVCRKSLKSLNICKKIAAKQPLPFENYQNPKKLNRLSVSPSDSVHKQRHLYSWLRQLDSHKAQGLSFLLFLAYHSSSYFLCYS